MDAALPHETITLATCGNYGVAMALAASWRA
jgi:cysteine synthase